VSYDPRVSTRGEGPPVVLVPGLDGTGLLFYRQVECLTPSHRVATFRLRDTATSMDTLVSDLREVVHHVASQTSAARAPVTIVGESFGGALSLSFALEHPDLVDRLVIINSFPYFAPQARLRLGYHLLRATPWGMMRIVRQLTAFRMHSPHTHRDELRKFHELMRQTTRQGYLSRLSILKTYDVRPRLSTLRIPTLFLASDSDHLVPAVEQAQLMASLAPRASMRVLNGHGHVCLIAPDLNLAEILNEWERATNTPKHETENI
jgi:pimeloyl-ACP methyl ester carboxylesterase